MHCVFFSRASERAQKKSTVEVVCRVLRAREQARQKEIRGRCVVCVCCERASERAKKIKNISYDIVRRGCALCIVFFYASALEQAHEKIVL